MTDASHPAHAASPIEQADVAVAEAGAAVRHHPLVEWGGMLSEVADQPPMIAISAATLAFGLVSGRRRAARAGVRMLASHLLATGIKTLIKDRVDRTRPRLLVDEGRYSMKAGDAADADMRSFPSGHTAGIVAVTRAVAREYPQTAVPGALLSAAIAAVQVPRCAHYPSDLGAGAAIGLVAEEVVHLGTRWLAR